MLTRPAAAAAAACRQCSRLHTLALQCAMFDQEITLERLAACTTIEVSPCLQLLVMACRRLQSSSSSSSSSN